MNEIVQLSPSRMPVASSIAKEFNLGPTEWRVLVGHWVPAPYILTRTVKGLSDRPADRETSRSS
jgi:hypothetical protein